MREKIEVLLEQSKQILHEVENNFTIEPKRKNWMRVAVGYLVSKTYDLLFEDWKIHQQCDETRTDLDYSNDFDCLVWYDSNDQVEKQLEKLTAYFILISKN